MTAIHHIQRPVPLLDVRSTVNAFSVMTNFWADERSCPNVFLLAGEATTSRYDPRQEPDALVAHVRICGGGGQ